jgi:hypothetical protein
MNILLVIPAMDGGRQRQTGRAPGIEMNVMTQGAAGQRSTDPGLVALPSLYRILGREPLPWNDCSWRV